MILKRKEIIAASLVVLIGMAGYLNWSYQDVIHVRDNDSYVETGKTLGEAEMVSANNEVTAADEESADNTDEAVQTDSQADEQAGREENTNNTDVQQTGQLQESAYFTDAKMNRESARASAMEALKEMSSDSSIDEATRTLAGEKLVACAANIETVSRIENVAAAKGFSEVCAYVNEGTATITVKSDNLSDEDAAKLTDIAVNCASTTADKVKVIAVK